MEPSKKPFFSIRDLIFLKEMQMTWSLGMILALFLFNINSRVQLQENRENITCNAKRQKDR